MATEGVGRAADEGGMDGEQSNVYGFTKHPSCNHPPTAIPYFAVDITAAGYMRARARVCIYVCILRVCCTMSVYMRGRVFVLQRMFVFGYNGDGYMDEELCRKLLHYR